MIRLRHLSALVLIVGSLLLPASCGSSNSDIPCKTRLDCSESTRLSERLGRCVNEAYCIDGACDGACVAPCEVVDANINPCARADLICNEPAQATPGTTYTCTGLPIPCASSADCPVYLPSEVGTWQCEDGFCAFPNFSYAQPNTK